MNSYKQPNFIFLILLIALPAVTAVSFTPSVPELVRIFAITKHQVSWIMTVFLLAYGASQLFYGPLANSIGRIKAIMLGLLLAFYGVSICIFGIMQESFTLFLIGRFILAMGAACGFGLTFTLINDSFAADAARRMSAYVSIGIVLVASLAIFINGFIVQNFGWFGAFVFQLIYIICVFTLLLLQTETSQSRDPTAVHLKNIWNKYYLLSNCQVLLFYSCIMGLISATSFFFNAYAPLILIAKSGLNVQKFGLFMLIPGVFYTIGNISTAELAHSISVSASIILGIFLYTIGTLLIMHSLSATAVSLYLFMAGIGVLFFSMPFIYSNSAVMALTNAHDKSSSAALMGSINIFLAFFMMTLIGYLNISIEKSMPCTFLFFISAIALLFVFSTKPVKFAIPGRFG